MTLQLGDEPDSLRVVMVDGGGWYAALHNTVGPWPDGAGIELTMTARDGRAWVWPATIDGAYATWRKTLDEAAEVAAGADAKLVYIEPGTAPVVWFDGAVVRP